jgi:catechol 2,3-dioxygenase
LRDKIAPSTRVGTISLTVGNLQKLVVFYQNTLGMRLMDRTDGVARLGVGNVELLSLHESPAAKRVHHSTGLFHLAILLPSRPALGAVLAHLIEQRTPLQGASDHLVSEAIYLEDPEGNGIEIYRDRPREQWSYRNGELRMATDPLDARGILAEKLVAPWTGLADGTVMGHVHLRVSEIEPAEVFYRDAIGLDITARYGGSASFLSAGGYHHHLGMNTWNSLHAPTPPAGSLGLAEYQLVLPSTADLDKLAARLNELNIVTNKADGQMRVSDPSGNRLVAIAAG